MNLPALLATRNWASSRRTPGRSAMTEQSDLFSAPAPADQAQTAIKIEALRNQLNHWAHQYYVLDEPTVPDAESGRVFRELQALGAAHPALIPPDWRNTRSYSASGTVGS